MRTDASVSQPLSPPPARSLGPAPPAGRRRRSRSSPRRVEYVEVVPTAGGGVPDGSRPQLSSSGGRRPARARPSAPPPTRSRAPTGSACSCSGPRWSRRRCLAAAAVRRRRRSPAGLTGSRPERLIDPVGRRARARTEATSRARGARARSGPAAARAKLGREDADAVGRAATPTRRQPGRAALLDDHGRRACSSACGPRRRPSSRAGTRRTGTGRP